jgi:PAS domain-containing protein
MKAYPSRTVIERTLKSLVLIRAKHLAESVTTPMFLIDNEGNMIFFNEAAEAKVGRPFADVGQIPVTEWQEQFRVRGLDDTPFPLEAMPGWMQLQKERSGVGHVLFTSFDGRDLYIAVCALPLFSGPDQFEGALVLFWEDEKE